MLISSALHRCQSDMLVEGDEGSAVSNGQRQKIHISYLVVAENFAEVDAFVIEQGNIVWPKFVI